jgi:hypothetical protein
MAAEGFINNTQLDFDTYKQSLKEYLQSQSRFQDYDFEASNLSVLLDILAYNTYHNAIYLNMIGSEMFLDTAQLRESIVSHAKELNYTPRSRSSSRISVDISASPTDTPDSITIPQYFTIRGTEPDGLVYYYSTSEPVLLSRSNSYYFSNVMFYEGTNKIEVFQIGTETTELKLTSNTLDTSSIVLEFRPSITDFTSETWNRAEDLYGLDGTDKVYFVEAAEDFKYKITFGNNVVGKKPAAGQVAVVTYRQTSGLDGNGLDNFSTYQSADGYAANTFSIFYTGSSFGGAFAEDTDSIRYNAVRGFTNLGRAVTIEDYISLVKANFPSLQNVIAYGGEESTPKRYGKVVISAKPFSSEIMTTAQKEEVINFLSDKTPMSIDPIIIDPEYLYVNVISKVTYNINATTKTAGQIKNLVVSAINTFNNNFLSNFGSDLRQSKLLATIDDADVSIVSNDTQLRISKRIVPTPGVSFKANWSFENPLYSENVRYVLPVGHEPIVYSETFVYDGYNAFIQDNGVGSLIVYTTRDGTTTSLGTIGTVNYDTGEINITDLVVDSYDGDYIRIYAKLENSDIATVTNKILLIDNGDISVSTVGTRI